MNTSQARKGIVKRGIVRRGGARRVTRRVLAVVLVVVLAALLVPMGYVYQRLWASTGNASQATAAEQDCITYVRPLTRLLAVLVDAQVAAVRGAPVDTPAVRAAVENVNRVDGQVGDPLQIRTRWLPLPDQINTALNQTATGQGAAHAYAVPLALIQALLVKVGDAGGVTRDPESDAYHLIDTALLRLPEVMTDAAQLSTLARANRSPLVAAIVVKQDRIASAAEAISVGLRSSTGTTTSSSVAMDVLKPLDEFAAAVDAMAQAFSVPDLSTGPVRANVDAAQTRLQKTSTTLQQVTLDVFEASLDRRASALVTQRGLTLVAGLLALVAVIVLAGLCLYGRAPIPEPSTMELERGPADGAPRGYQQHPGPVIDARDLLHPELVHAGSQDQTMRRRERP